MPPPPRLLPSVHDLLLGLLRAPLAAAYPGVTVGTLIPARMTYPFVLVRRAGGATIDPRFLDRPLVDVQTWDTNDRQAENLVESARALLVLAWRRQTVVPGVGSISFFRDQAMSTLLPDQTVPDGVYRYQATVELAVRPAR
ncbi:hypothetical protein SAMN05421505_14932 [Sinosporangium album]|uniref:Tail terminator n=1 Tax=Sinosporangium album TaxID=504805 RepID=A0A1G8KCJ9_9ACTN|nr:hypothetical protein [Sinosporangium album]SDI41138.1 hypothetical protein SAMN05421505_14932 [Sinosporangium album]